MKKILIILGILLISFKTYAITFPVDKENCIISKRTGRILLTGWYWEKRKNSRHKAMDLPARTHTPIRAVKSGKVIEKGYQYISINKSFTAYGNYVKIQDKDGYVWIYAHLTSYDVKTGEEVVEGQTIATVGWTGVIIKHPHLHLEKRNMNNERIFFTTDFGVLFSLSKNEKRRRKIN